MLGKLLASWRMHADVRFLLTDLRYAASLDDAGAAEVIAWRYPTVARILSLMTGTYKERIRDFIRTFRADPSAPALAAAWIAALDHGSASASETERDAA